MKALSKIGICTLCLATAIICAFSISFIKSAKNVTVTTTVVVPEHRVSTDYVDTRPVLELQKIDLD